MATSTEDGIPVIDVSGIHAGKNGAGKNGATGNGAAGDAAALAAIGRQIAAACRDTGFFYIAGHGVPDALVDGVFEANRTFHARAEAEKLPLKLNAWHRGYQPMASTRMTSSLRFAPATMPNQLESFIIRDAVAESDPRFKREPFFGPNQWPDDPVFRARVEGYHTALRVLAGDLLPAFACAVGNAPDYFDRFFDPPSTTLRLVHYPPHPPNASPDHIGIYPHTDYGFFTILAQDDVGGLEIQRVDGRWIEAPHIPGTFVMNIGDAMARWTNDVFNSSPHRVINKSTTRDRYSVALFFDPNYGATIECLDGFADTPADVRHLPIRYLDYYRERMDSNHPDRAPAD